MTGQPKQLSLERLFELVEPDCRERFTEIVELIDAFCGRHLNDEYRYICRKMAGAICVEGSPVLKGKPASWACGVTYAAGRINFLHDPAQKPHMNPDDVAKGYGVSSATMYAKGRIVWDGLDLMPFHPSFTVASLAERNLLIWMLTVNGRLMDIRDAPRDAQVVAYERGLIPYIPADRA
ncbi:MAG TPA: DUF6398 domain-containing protein [Pirellulaceae bacterium]|nr:DUF6398 domain-containing protein [Pirellulaceae bacterium]